jgi:hypothetical protein
MFQQWEKNIVMNFKALPLRAASIGVLLIALSSSAEDKQKPEETPQIKQSQIIDCKSIRNKAHSGSTLTDNEKAQLIKCTLLEDKSTIPIVEFHEMPIYGLVPGRCG